LFLSFRQIGPGVLAKVFHISLGHSESTRFYYSWYVIHFTIIISIVKPITSTNRQLTSPNVLGKLCLQNEMLAKDCIPALTKELETSQDPAVRNNITVVLCDLCVRYRSTIAN
jgi:hypothetical protein